MSGFAAAVHINAVHRKGQTALHGAVYFGGTMLVPFLVDRPGGDRSREVAGSRDQSAS